MSTKPNKKIQGPSLYAQFIDAHMKAHLNEKQSVNYLYR